MDGEYREDKGDAFELRDGLSEDTDFSFVPEAFWQDIVLGEAPVASPPFASSSSTASVERYGRVDGAPAVQRGVFERGGGVDENGVPLPGAGGTIEVKPRLAHVFGADEDTGVARSPFRDAEREGQRAHARAHTHVGLGGGVHRPRPACTPVSVRARVGSRCDGFLPC